MPTIVPTRNGLRIVMIQEQKSVRRAIERIVPNVMACLVQKNEQRCLKIEIE